jgi:hypothetical protein
MCRGGRVEPLVVQFCGWNTDRLKNARSRTVKELNDLSYGLGFGDTLWEQAESDLMAHFDEEALKVSQTAWECIFNFNYDNMAPGGIIP